MNTLTGRVIKCHSEFPSRSVSETTHLEIKPRQRVKKGKFRNDFEVQSLSGEYHCLIPVHELSDNQTGIKLIMRGRHRIDAGETIRVSFVYNGESSEYWAYDYEILKKGKVVYSEKECS